MKNFSYKKKIDPQDVIINEPKKKINKQQKIFTLFFIILFAYLAWYFTKDAFVTTFDGNIVSHHNNSYLMNDVFLFEIKVKPGDVVNAGDTILSYVYTDMLYSALNPIEFNFFQQKQYALNMSKGEKQLELKTLIRQRMSLRKLAEKTHKNISLGLNTMSDEVNYSIEIEQVKQNIDYTKKIIEHYNNSLDSLNAAHEKSFKDALDPFEHTMNHTNNNIYKFGDIIKYLVASEKTLILAINKYPGNIVFKKESIMLVYPITEGQENIYIEMIVPPMFLNEMRNGDKVKILFGNSDFGDGTIQINNTYMKIVSSFKLGQFSAEKEAAIIRVDIDSSANLSLKYQVSGLPVKLQYTRKW